MADPSGKIVLNIVRKDCPSVSCPYRYGDGVNVARLGEKISEKLKHRVADGNEVRALERRVAVLESTCTRVLEAADKGRKLNAQEIALLKNTLQKKS